jgi:predicted transcriptional regulator
MRKGTAIGHSSFCFCLVVGCFASKVTKMLNTREPSERNCPTFDTIVEILRELKEPTGITSILANCNFNFKQSECRLGFVKSSDVTWTNAVMTVALGHYDDMLFQYRKKRPQERGRKKRRKGKWDPIDRLWNRAN